MKTTSLWYRKKEDLIEMIKELEMRNRILEKEVMKNGERNKRIR
jgi:hypothetical protein